jgi:hypothetical protein
MRFSIFRKVFYVQKGKIKLTVVSERGKEAVVGHLWLAAMRFPLKARCMLGSNVTSRTSSALPIICA